MTQAAVAKPSYKITGAWTKRLLTSLHLLHASSNKNGVKTTRTSGADIPEICRPQTSDKPLSRKPIIHITLCSKTGQPNIIILLTYSLRRGARKHPTGNLAGQIIVCFVSTRVGGITVFDWRWTRRVRRASVVGAHVGSSIDISETTGKGLDVKSWCSLRH